MPSLLDRIVTRELADIRKTRALAIRAEAEAAALQLLDQEHEREKLEAEGWVKKVARWRDDPVGYALERIPGCRLTPKQKAILRAIAKRQKVAVKSGQKTGKTYLLAIAVLWYAETRPGAVVVAVSNSADQLRDQLWKELRVLGDLLGYRLPLLPSSAFRLPNGSTVAGRSADTIVSLAGYSSPVGVFFVLDEGSGIPTHVFEAAEGNLLIPGSKLATGGNPTSTSGHYFSIFHDPRKLAEYETFTLSALADTDPTIPGMAGRAECEAMIREHGEKSPMVEIRVFGRFPSSAANAVVSLESIDAANRRLDAASRLDEEHWAKSRLHLGVDVARFGSDDSVILPRRGQRAYVALATVRHGEMTTELAREVLRVAKRFARPGERVLVKVDGGGIGGGPCDLLAEYAAKLDDMLVDYESGRRPSPPPFTFDLVEVNSGERADDENRYHNKRSQLHFDLAAWISGGGVFERDSRLTEELAAPTYAIDPKLRKVVEPKGEVKKRLPGGRSPDVADALALAVYEPPVGYRGKLPKVKTYESPIADW